MIKIDENIFKFGLIGKGKKLHIFPKRFSVALCLRGSINNDAKIKSESECKECLKQYEAGKNNPLFRLLLKY